MSETTRALRAEENEQDAAIYLTAALEGLRRSELLALRWEDVDFEQSWIRVSRRLQRQNERQAEVAQVAHRPDGRQGRSRA